MAQKTVKITLAVLISFIISFSIFSFTLYSYHENIVKFGAIVDSDKSSGLKDAFYSQNFVNEEKIFLIGSSQAGPLNSTHIEKVLKNSKHDYHVYNLAENGDKPIFRLKELEMIVSSNPTFVIYEITSRDFEDTYPHGSSTNKPVNSLPEPLDIFKNLFPLLFNYLEFDFDLYQNPKIDTFKILRSIINKYEIGSPPSKNIISDSALPLMRYLKSDTIEKNDIELKKMLSMYGNFNRINPSNENQNVIALKKIITELHNNNIKVIIFMAPEHKFYLENMPQKEKTSFEVLLKNISKEKKVNVYNLRDKYNNLDIWADPTHLVINKNSLIYSNDIAQIILKEIQE